MKARRWLCGVLLAAHVWVPAPVPAGEIVGIRITQTGNTGLTVHASVTAFLPTTVTDSTVDLGTAYRIPAVDWGDGAKIAYLGGAPGKGIPFVTTSTRDDVRLRVYRGSFSHTYGQPGRYAVAANSGCCPQVSGGSLVEGMAVATTISTLGLFGPTTFTTSFAQSRLEVVAQPLGFRKLFVPQDVRVGMLSRLTYQLDNATGREPVTGLRFTDHLPAGLAVATPPNLLHDCAAGRATAAPRASTVSFVNGTVDARSRCTVGLDVRATASGHHVSISESLRTASGGGATAMAILDVHEPPFLSKDFSPSVLPDGGLSVLTFVIDNTANARRADGLAFVDDLPRGLQIADPANVVSTCVGGATAADPGDRQIAYRGGSIPGRETCWISVDILVVGRGGNWGEERGGSGIYRGLTGELESSLGVRPAGGATAVLTVQGTPIPTLSTGRLVVFGVLITAVALVIVRRNRLRQAS